VSELTNLLNELRFWYQALELTKFELFVIIGVAICAPLVPTMLKHRREMTALRLDFRLESDKIAAKIETEREKRKRKALGKKK